jgi:hypothetical protein
VALWGERTWNQAEEPVWEGRIARGQVKREAPHGIGVKEAAGERRKAELSRRSEGPGGF